MEKKTIELPIQIVVDKNLLKKEIERVLIECSNAVFIGLASISDLDRSPNDIKGENEFLRHQPFLTKMNLLDSKVFFKSWIVKKGIEDLIKGVTLMLIEVCKVIEKQKVLHTNNPQSVEELNKILNLPEHKFSKKHFPNLIEIIMPFLNQELSYLDEINSINRIRRCLVHRDGLVTSLDIQEGESDLKLKWIYFDIDYEVNRKKSKLDRMTMMTTDGKILLEEQRRFKQFNESEKIDINYQLFNELIWTVFKFGEDLIRKLDFSLGMKDADNQGKASQ